MRLASTSSVLKFHEFPSGELVNTYSPAGDCTLPIQSLSWSRDGTWLALVPPNGIAEIITVKDRPRPLMAIRDIPVTSVMFPNNSKRTIALGTTNKEVMIYDVKTKNVKQKYEKCPGNVIMVDYTAKDSHVVAALDNGEIFLFSNVVKKMTSKFTIPRSSSVSSIRCHYSKRNYIIAGSSEGVVALYDSNVNKIMYSTEAHLAAISGLAFSPLRLDLMVSSGLDRQLIFYDIICRAKVAQINLENNPTSVDYAPDGIHLAVSGQNGKIYVYDTRSVDTPIHFFEAHSSKITKVYFQKDGSNADGSFCIPAEEETHEPFIKTECNSEHNSALFCSDPVYTLDSKQISEKSDETKQDAGGDSFLVAMGLNSMDTKNESSCTNINPSPSVHPTSAGKSALERQLMRKQISASTPTCFAPEMSPSFSPVFKFNMKAPTEESPQVTATAQNATSLTLTAAEIREIVREEVKLELEKVHKDMQFGLYDIVSQIRRHFLDLQMSLVKEFLQLETNLNKLKQELLIDEPCYSEDMLIQENYRLKRELLLLKEKSLEKNKSN